MGIEVALLFYCFWLFIGLLWGGLSLQLKRFFPVNKKYMLAASTTSAVILVLICTRGFWHLDDSWGWGFYAIPPCIVGVITAYSWVKDYYKSLIIITIWEFVIGTIALSNYFGVMEEQSYGINYWHAQMRYDSAAVDKVLSDFTAQIDATITYLTVALLLQIVPFLVLSIFGKLRSFVAKPLAEM